MNLEIERKFLVRNDNWKLKSISGYVEKIVQGYLSNENGRVVRIRIVNNTNAYLCVKIAKSINTREEYECPIPYFDAVKILMNFKTIEKIRHVIPAGNIKWEVDVFSNGLVLAEVELKDINQSIILPDWIGKEVTNDPKYLNCNMV